MHPRARCVSLLCLCLAVPAFFGSVRAQTEKTITVRMIDTRTGILIASSNYLVRINHIREEHGDWIVKNEDGRGKLTLTPGAEEISVHATYERANMSYVNCGAEWLCGEKSPGKRSGRRQAGRICFLCQSIEPARTAARLKAYCAESRPS